jgi:ribonuclease T2
MPALASMKLGKAKLRKCRRPVRHLGDGRQAGGNRPLPWGLPPACYRPPVIARLLPLADYRFGRQDFPSSVQRVLPAVPALDREAEAAAADFGVRPAVLALGWQERGDARGAGDLFPVAVGLFHTTVYPAPALQKQVVPPSVMTALHIAIYCRRYLQYSHFFKTNFDKSLIYQRAFTLAYVLLTGIVPKSKRIPTATTSTASNFGLINEGIIMLPKYFKWIAATIMAVANTCAASERASGQFVASRACDAYSSFVKGNNPGSVRTTPGTQYEVLQVNKAEAFEWIRIDILGAEPHERWVPTECGLVTFEDTPEKSRDGGKGKSSKDPFCHTANKHDSYVLAITWQPGFCEHAHYNGKKPECDALAERELSIDNLTLHGLWPNRKECGIKYDTCRGDGTKAFSLNEDTVSRIAPWMPNFYYERVFGKYEWDKHGTCQSLAPDAYFDNAVNAVKLVNDSEIGLFIRSHIGAQMAVTQFYDHVKQHYGDEVASNIQLVCTGRNYLQEIRFRLPKDFTVHSGMSRLVGGTGFPSRVDGCGADVYVEASGPD